MIDARKPNAFDIPIDQPSRLILFSDIHRGDNSWAYEFAHNQSLFLFALEHYFRENYTFIELAMAMNGGRIRTIQLTIWQGHAVINVQAPTSRAYIQNYILSNANSSATCAMSFDSFIQDDHIHLFITDVYAV